MRSPALSLIALAACGGPSAMPDAPMAPVVPTANAAREITDTRLGFDLTALTGTATITLGPSAEPGATLEVNDLVLESVRLGEVDLAYAERPTPGTTKRVIDLALPASDAPIEVAFGFRYKTKSGFQGASAAGYTFLWPYHCGNLFPCHSDPRDGTPISLELTGVPAGKQVIFPAAVTDAPSYQIAWSVDSYTELPLGTTDAGTQVSVWYRATEETAATNGTANLRAVFDWLEKTIGPYRFGTKVGSVSVKWGPGAYGGMEHHPLWHVSSSSIADQETHAHEAAHGWFGAGIRIACWEDFVLSEGTVTYLAGRALDVVAPSVGAAVWTGYESELAALSATAKVWPRTCNTVDIIEDDLFTNAPYIRGAFFYRGVALKVGADKVDQAIAAFYAAHAGKPARMTDMLATIHAVTGYDPTTCAQLWLESTTKPAPGACP